MRGQERLRYFLPFCNEHQKPLSITRNGKEGRFGPTLRPCFKVWGEWPAQEMEWANTRQPPNILP